MHGPKEDSDLVDSFSGYSGDKEAQHGALT